MLIVKGILCCSGYFCSLLQSHDLQVEHKGKLLIFLCQKQFNNSSIVPVGYVCKINKFFSELLQGRIFFGNISKPAFRRQESISLTEVDGTTAGNVHTILTLSKLLLSIIFIHINIM